MISQWFPLLLIDKQRKPLQTDERAMKSIAKSLKKQQKPLQTLERAMETIAKSLKIAKDHNKTIEKTMKAIANHRKGSENIAKLMKKQRNHCKHNGMRMTTTGKTIEKAKKTEETIAQPLGNL